jgi:hypothetical protein
MDPNEKELMEQLARDPLTRGGFDNRLRQRIEERINRDEWRIKRPWKSVWRLPAAALASVVVVLMGIWLWNGQTGKEQGPGSSDPSITQEAAASRSALRGEQPKKFALLIGLRTDRSVKGHSFATSSYRTILVAPEAQTGRQQLIVDHAGLYVPYEQNFWQIATVSAPGGRQALQAVKITGTQKRTFKDLRIPSNLLSERVMFAGNRYLSIRSTVRDAKGRQAENHWVKTIDNVDTKSADPATEPHVRLEGVLPDMVSNPPMEQWSIVRNPGQWMADLPNAAAAGMKEENFPAPLPKEVVNPDSLSMSWNEILKTEPAAQDAFTYGTVLAVVTGKDIRVHAIRDGTALPDAVSIPLSKGESVIMIQWAEDGYVERWIQEMRVIPGDQP